MGLPAPFIALFDARRFDGRRRFDTRRRFDARDPTERDLRYRTRRVIYINDINYSSIMSLTMLSKKRLLAISRELSSQNFVYDPYSASA